MWTLWTQLNQCIDCNDEIWLSEDMVVINDDYKGALRADIKCKINKAVRKAVQTIIISYRGTVLQLPVHKYLSK